MAANDPNAGTGDDEVTRVLSSLASKRPADTLPRAATPIPGADTEDDEVTRVLGTVAPLPKQTDT